jgi:hypothetical protein
MRVSIGTNIKEGPWGGGNLFAKGLKSYLEKNNHQVFTDLSENNLDIILITEPRKTSESSSFTHDDVLKYLKYTNSKSIIVHRLNECDERKNTKYVNKFMINANKIADASIFVSSWLKNLYITQGMSLNEKHIILAGADKTIFNSKNFIPWDKKSKLKIVTHHWGENWNKGFEIYTFLDELLDDEEWSKKISFTYIGNIPKKAKFRNTKVIAPLSGQQLSNEIKNNHLYLTASINEPSGNHHIEAAQCGLPLLFINSGGIPEYCQGYGVMFENKNDFIQKLEEIYNNYEVYVAKMASYPYDANNMSEEYLQLFNNLLKSRHEVLSKRKVDLSQKFFEKKIYNLKN